MARKYDIIAELYEWAAKRIVSDPLYWEAFLRSACRNYKLRFDEQLLIFAQRPSATAVLPIERWNERYGRWVNRGAAGIAVFEDENRSRQWLIHYFDISDTHESLHSRPVLIWKMREEYEPAVLDALESSFGEIEDKSSFFNALVSAAKNATDANLADYLLNFLDVAKNTGSFTSRDEAEALFRGLVQNSAAVMLMSRLDIIPWTALSAHCFDGIERFDEPQLVNCLGVATSNIAEILLTDVARTIIPLEKQNRTFALNKNEVYNEDTIQNQRSDGNGRQRNRTDLYQAGGLLYSGFEAAGTAGRGVGTIRSDEASVSEGEKQNPVLQSPNDLQADRALGGNGTESDGAGGDANKADGRKRRRHGRAESERHDVVGPQNEQHPQPGGRDSESGGNIRLGPYDRKNDASKPLPTAEEQISLIENLAEDNSPAFVFSDEKATVDPNTTPKQPAAPSSSKSKNRIRSFDLHPEIPMSERHTFDPTLNPVETVGKKERFRRNTAAIRLLKRCSEENRFATPEEQLILSKYVGWGGIPEAFDENNASWTTECSELKSLLTPEEYTAARESTLTAFYTPPEVTAAIYSALSQMGFREGNLLEPSCGIGNFIGMLPQSMENAKIYGVEIDPVSAGIAQQLYQKSSITACGFEKADMPDSFFDGVVGNVPFGDFKVLDKRYDKYNFLIHDYFFAKCLDKLRPGGVMALVTSKGTMDKTNPAVRKYIAQRADLLGAIRLPNNTFGGNAGTEVVSDILFLQKRDRVIDIEPDWVHLDIDKNGIKMNSYFVQHPEMVLGEMKTVPSRFGKDKTEETCEPFEGAVLSEQLAKAVSNIHGSLTEHEVDDELEVEDKSIPADPTVRNFSYAVLDDVIYFRENSKMTPVEVSAAAGNRIKGMIAIRNCVRDLIDLQAEDFPDGDIEQAQEKLNTLYDNFTAKYGLINSRANASAFADDSSYALLAALEVLNENGELERKADMFTKRTIRPHVPVTKVDTASEALAVSMGEKAAVDMEYMQQLSGKSEQELFDELRGVIFLNPLYGTENSSEHKYLMADEYLSGNVREKLATAKWFAEISPEEFTVNVEALEKVQPKDLSASEISVRLGATWLPQDTVKQFIFELLDTPFWIQQNIKVHFSSYTGEWNIEAKTLDHGLKAQNTYGTSRINAYKIIEDTLNLKDVRIYDYVEDIDGKRKAELNKKETAIAQSKQELIKQAFQNWIWDDPIRREKLTKLYNEKFNSLRPREYDGSHITFSGMNPEIELREHQKNAVAHILYGGNTLLAHAVGAGKTYEMVAAAQESKRLGLCNKSLFVVPNHLTEQWAAEYLQLYPAANILVATKKDFETKNRKKFCGRIATGDYDAVIIGHSQFEKIPMSVVRQREILEQQLEEIVDGIQELKDNRGDRFSVKQLEKTRKSLLVKLEKLNDQTRKDDVVTFEELGVDRLFVDESHYYKNLFLYTKMRNVGGIAQTEAQKSSDLFAKCRYLDEITGGRGTVFATGTPISNSMVELYTIQRYLQYDVLKKNGLHLFDAWASTFGETVTAVELTPEGYNF